MGLAATGMCAEPLDRFHLNGLPAAPLIQIKRRPTSSHYQNSSPRHGGNRDRFAMLRLPLRHALVALLLMTPALAASPAEQRGKAYARTHCARCHSIDGVTKSRLPAAPPFRTLHRRYPVETLGEAFAEGIYTGHAAMPSDELNPDQIHDLLSFLKTFE
jgi:mono/diheme cytochrome c family protein